MDARRHRADGAEAGACVQLRRRHPRPAAPGAGRADGPARAAAARARASGRDRLGPLRPADEAPRVRARGERLPGEAVRARRIGRSAPSPAATTCGQARREPRPRRDAHARSRASAGAHRRARGRSLGPRVPAPPPSRRARGHDREPRAPAVGGVGLPLRSRARTSSRSACGVCARSSERMRRSRRFAMRVTGFARRSLARDRLGRVRGSRTSPRWRSWPSWETIPFHFIWVSLTLLYGFRIWRPAGDRLRPCRGGGLATGLPDHRPTPSRGEQLWGELFEVPLMSAMFLAMVWHARRRQEALAKVERRPRSARRCSSSRSGSSTTSRTSCVRRSRSRAATSSCSGANGTGRSTRSTSPSTSSAGWSGSSSGCSCSRRPSSPTSSSRRHRRSSRSSRTSSCAGRRSRRARGGSARCRRELCAPTRRRFGSRSTRCSRTPSSTRTLATRSSCGARGEGKTS